MYDTILLPTDGSAGAAQARDHAFALAEEQDATLHVLHVVDTLSPGASLHEMIAERMVAQGTALVELVAKLARERGLAVETTVVEGRPFLTGRTGRVRERISTRDTATCTRSPPA